MSRRGRGPLLFGALVAGLAVLLALALRPATDAVRAEPAAPRAPDRPRTTPTPSPGRPRPPPVAPPEAPPAPAGVQAASFPGPEPFDLEQFEDGLFGLLELWDRQPIGAFCDDDLVCGVQWTFGDRLDGPPILELLRQGGPDIRGLGHFHIEHLQPSTYTLTLPMTEREARTFLDDVRAEGIERMAAP